MCEEIRRNEAFEGKKETVELTEGRKDGDWGGEEGEMRLCDGDEGRL